MTGLETTCVFSYDKNGDIVPNTSKEWTRGDENGEWRDGTSCLDALNVQPFGLSSRLYGISEKCGSRYMGGIYGA